MPGYNTNLAAEFYVLSVLHRLGADAYLTLGNKKSVDIVAVRAAGDTATIDVKGLAGNTCWNIANAPLKRERHFLALVTYLGRITEVTSAPQVYILPSTRVAEFRSPGNWADIRVATMKRRGQEFLNAWKQLL